MNAEGNEWQPTDAPVTVNLKIPGTKLSDSQIIRVAHMHDDEVEFIDTVFNGDTDTVTFVTDGFSTFYGFVVDFEFNGEEFSLAGMSEVTLSSLLMSLAIEYDVEDVEKVEFTNSEVISVQKGEDGDWVLKSLKSFFTEEYLDVYFNDGTLVSILVTDPVTHYFLTDTGTDYCESTKNVTISYKNDSSYYTYGTYVRNTTAIDTDAKDGEAYVVYDVYMHPGMALALDSTTYSPHGDWPGTPVDGEYYTWVWDTNASTNYYVIDSDINEYKTVTIQTYDGSTTTTTKECLINLHIVPKKTAPTLVEDTLSESSKYTVSSLPVTLYNYDGKLFNADQKVKTNNLYLGFNNKSMGVSATAGLSDGLPWTSPANSPNSGSISTGIMQSTLDANKLPVVNHKANTDLFSTTSSGGNTGKTVYEDVDFQFIYNKETGYYTYSSNLNHAQFFPDGEGSGSIKLYNETLSPQVVGSGQPGQSGFYPFVDINDALVNYLHDGKHQNWDSGVLENEFTPQNALYSKDFVYTDAANSTVDMHYGLQLVADFYMPVGGAVDFNDDGVSEELVYQFTGDDDLWVFIDNTLVLDLGGAHTYVNGKIDFTNEKVILGSYAPVTQNGDGWKSNGTNQSNKEFTFAELGITVEEDQMHTLRVFYLERWSGVSNCRMHFNLPIVPANSVVVNKKLTNQDGEAMDLDTSYEFQMLTKNESVHHETAYTAETPALRKMRFNS